MAKRISERTNKPVRKYTRKAKAEVPPTAASPTPPKREGYIYRSKWTEVAQPNEFAVELHMAEGSAGKLLEEHLALAEETRRLKSQIETDRARYDDLAKRHAFLLRDSAAQARILATYREAAALQAESEGGGYLALAG